MRWLLLAIAAAQILALPGRPGMPVYLLFLAGAGLNFGLMAIELMGPRPLWFGLLPIALDFGFGLSLYALTGGSLGRLGWLALLPGLTAGLRLHWTAGLATAATFVAGQVWLETWMTPPVADGVLRMGLMAASIAPLVAAGGFVGVRLRAAAAEDWRQQREAEERRIHVLRQHARAIYEMSAMVSARFDYHEVLEAALNFGALGAEGHLPTASAMVSAVLFFQDDELRVASCRRFTTADQRAVCPGRAGVLGQVIRSGEPAVIADPMHDPELARFASLHACRTLMALPLRAGFETYGVVVYGHPHAVFFDSDQQAMLTAVVNQAIIALQNAQLYRSLREEKERLVEVQEETQKKLARELHDGPTQAIAALTMRANFVRRLVQRDPQKAGEELFKMEDLARSATKEIRQLLFTLRPLVLESQGLVAALQQLAEKIGETHGQQVLVDCEPGVSSRLELNHQAVLFYIVEEAINNARKHAQAANIWVSLKTGAQDVLEVEIKDDGVGFNVGAVEANYERRGSLGFVNMRERAEMINGAVHITSVEGRGTRVMVYVPLSVKAPEGARP